MIKETLQKLMSGNDLTEQEAQDMMNAIMGGELTPAQIAGLLIALRIKKETVAEITGCARVMRDKALKVELDGLECMDTCGTGGDGSGTYNISTAAAFVLAGAGVAVAKHGNRSMSSRCGSADVLEALGAKVDLSPEEVARCIREAGFGFMYAPAYHSAMKYAIGPRKELGVRTVFNMLGPLTNPAGATRQVMGVYDAALTHPIAEVLGRLGAVRALVVHGSDGLDELTVTGPTYVSELKQDGTVENYEIHPEGLGLGIYKSEELRGGDAAENAAIIRGLLSGDKGARRDILLLNSAAALYVAGKASDIPGGVEIAKNIIDSGLAMEKLEAFIACTKEAAA
jgi:anthranilate phosphoribosyltransferase